MTRGRIKGLGGRGKRKHTHGEFIGDILSTDMKCVTAGGVPSSVTGLGHVLFSRRVVNFSTGCFDVIEVVSLEPHELHSIIWAMV